MNASATRLFKLFLLLLVIFFITSACVPTQTNMGVTGAADIDSTAAACALVARELNHKFPLAGQNIQISEDYIQERQTKAQLPYSRILSDALSRELAGIGALVSVEKTGTAPLILHAGYVVAGNRIIIDVKLRRIATNMQSHEVAIAEVAIPAASLDQHWLRPTISTQAEALVRHLAENYTGTGFKLLFTKSVPGTAGQPSMRLGRELDQALQEAVSRTQVFPVSMTSQRQISLQASYTVTDSTINLKAWLEDARGEALATATGSIAITDISAGALTPMANVTTTACVTLAHTAGHQAAAGSEETATLAESISGYLQELGIEQIACAQSTPTVPQVTGSVTQLPVKSTRDGYTFTTIVVKVQILGTQGNQLGSFHNQARQSFSGDIHSANIKAVRKAADATLKKELARALLSVSP
jgi:hypothetical protein